MDTDFVRELIVLAVVVALYMFGSAMLLRGHTTDLSAVNGTPGNRRAAAGGGTTTAEPRLNRRRKARLRDAIERGEVQPEGKSTGDELAED